MLKVGEKVELIKRVNPKLLESKAIVRYMTQEDNKVESIMAIRDDSFDK